MDNNFWSIAIGIFLCILSFIKYSDADKLKLWIENFLEKISPLQEIEEDEVVELEEVTELIHEFIIRNQKIFCNINNIKDEQKSG
tara:strand:- start:666 stop:920 length:255 start_codon:yes stop_codon:yes gene_type:complete